MAVALPIISMITQATVSAYQAKQQRNASKEAKTAQQLLLEEQKKSNQRPDVANAAQAEAAMLAKRRGMMSTILTGSQGIMGGMAQRQTALGA